MINTFCKKIQAKKINFFILPNSDEFFLEYLPNNQKRIEFLTNFSGSNALCVFATNSKQKHQFFTDGRYILQAKKQLDEKKFAINDMTEISVLNWLEKNAKQGEKVGINPQFFSLNFVKKLKEICEIIFIEEDIVAQIWKNRPSPKNSEIFEHKTEFAGISFEKKIAWLKRIMKNDAIFINNPESICWLLNLRASDVEFSPILACNAIFYKNQKMQLFVDKSRFIDDNFVKKLSKYVEFAKNLNQAKSKSANQTIEIDPNQINYAIYQALKQSFAIVEKTNPILQKKAIKNATEIKNAIKAHQIDGVAVTKFLHWLENSKKTDELSAEAKMLEFRQKSKEFHYPSFRTISGFASNGAIIHYSANEESNKKFTKNQLYLIDSGGQYSQGTTDITRTVAIGKISQEIKHNFTLVLKGHIALATAKFNDKTPCQKLDFLARKFLLKEKKDYAHGTGHGVGSFLSVHESPPSISKRSINSSLKAGMIVSNEPGFYQNDEYGIRIENLVLVKQNKDSLYFETITLAPIDHNLIEFEILTKKERLWLKKYHEKIYKDIKENLETAEIAWLDKIVKKFQKSA
jgi:Xaa-Pro aminopeptidase